ncbi:MAG: hypothetical protein A3E61_00255 [Candidatus Colwellbacteria bacterium RIFCSPHIGHO2_12_FULL_43_12]|uniref:Uncharacterized protein n=3 Tax=Candidatus Colwelliibacteriota TaxID=1817904 RepID=A0A1G1YZH1_9BACT|nr:MAG: hypothetical protein A3D47_02560 [Candidatus Colwellbacteria bacterium RIFCSPHIGHO2_02_FULL_43_15]OGY58472.1 MAG: hypothetical protein A3E61_00255 [Candidatus Colwellbacteria bacterium RIFCSPHIGHO2_12_FULL_43_12]OGY61183.1 MAG: hypothetical protein A3F99_00810 [Candidatus Colwellbacteria bacterium RIFCSPLOWO2_12_FULL_43_11]
MENIKEFITIGATLAFLGLIIVFVVLTTVLNYHWNRYGIEPERVKKVKQIYFTVAITLLILTSITYLNILW